MFQQQSYPNFGGPPPQQQTSQVFAPPLQQSAAPSGTWAPASAAPPPPAPGQQQQHQWQPQLQQQQPQQQQYYGQQQQQQQQYYGQQQPPMGGCCGPQPGQPPGPPGCCSAPGQPPGQPPHGYCCNPPVPNEPPMWPLHQMCDITTCAVMFLTLMAIIGFAVVLGTTKPDNLMRVYSLSGEEATSSHLAAHIISDIPWKRQRYWQEVNDSITWGPVPLPPGDSDAPLTPHPSVETDAPTEEPSASGTEDSSNSTETGAASELMQLQRLSRYLLQATPTSPPPELTSVSDFDSPVPVTVRPCMNGTTALPGTFARLCVEEALSAEVFLVALSGWHKFRAILYFTAMMGSLVVLALIVIVHRVQHPPPQFGQPGAAAAPQFAMPEPWAFFGTRLYEVFRVAWGVVSVVMFMWIYREMDSYWRLVPFFKAHTDGPLREFWNDYDRKFVATVVCGGIYVCWPLCELALEIALWFAGIVPWFVYRSMCAQGIGQVRNADAAIEDLPGCVRLDMFFVDCEQVGRLGFSTRMWELLTGTRAKYFDCLDQCGQQQALPQYGGAAGAGGWQQQPQPQQQWQPPQAPSMTVAPPRPGLIVSDQPPVTRGFGAPSPPEVQQPSDWQASTPQQQQPPPVSTSASGNFLRQSGGGAGAFDRNNTSGSFTRTSRSFAADESSDDDKRSKKSKKDKKEKKEKKEKREKKEKKIRE